MSFDALCTAVAKGVGWCSIGRCFTEGRPRFRFRHSAQGDWSNSKFAILKIDGLIGRRRAHSLWKTRSLLQLLPFAIEKNIRPSWAMRSQSQLNHYDAVRSRLILTARLMLETRDLGWGGTGLSFGLDRGWCTSVQSAQGSHPGHRNH